MSPVLETFKSDTNRSRQLRRALSILKILEETKTEWRSDDLAGLFDVGLRTIWRDLLALRDTGYPIAIRGGRTLCFAQWLIDEQEHRSRCECSLQARGERDPRQI